MALERRTIRMFWVATMCSGTDMLLIGLRALETDGILAVKMGYRYALEVDMLVRGVITINAITIKV